MAVTRDVNEVAEATNNRFSIGSKYETRDLLKEDGDDFGKSNLFNVILCGYNQMRCSCYRPTKNDSAGEDEGIDNALRSSAPIGTGCPWLVTFSRSKKRKEVTIKSVSPLHNHPLTQSTYVNALNRSGKVTKKVADALTEVLASTVTSRNKPSLPAVREKLEPFVKDVMTVSSKNVGNLLGAVKRRIDNGDYVPNSLQVDVSSLEQLSNFSGTEQSASRCQQILDACISNTSNGESWQVLSLMRGILAADPERFRYRIHYNDEGQIDGIMWQDGRSRAALSKHGAKAFWDMRLAEGQNRDGYVYCAWILIDSNRQICPGVESVLLGETNALYEFVHKGAIELTPGFSARDVKLAFVDDRLNFDDIRAMFPDVLVMLDTFHFLKGNRGISILSKDFGGNWTKVKEAFGSAVYAKTEEECEVSVLFPTVPCVCLLRGTCVVSVLYVPSVLQCLACLCKVYAMIVYAKYMQRGSNLGYET